VHGVVWGERMRRDIGPSCVRARGRGVNPRGRMGGLRLFRL